MEENCSWHIKMNHEKHVLKVLQYLFDEGFLKLWVDKHGVSRISLTTELDEIHEAIRSKFSKPEKTDWWKQ